MSVGSSGTLPVTGPGPRVSLRSCSRLCCAGTHVTVCPPGTARRSTVAREGPRVPVWGRRPCTMIRARSRVLREPNQAGGPGSREEGQPRRRDCCTIATRRGVVGRAVYQGYKEKNSRDGGGYSTSSTNFHKVGFNAASLSGPHAEKRVASAGGRPRPLLAMGRLREKMMRGIQWWAGRSVEM